ncbi:MAG: hypothetical protein DRP46_09405 [Candidatus Zixiibacteriota bacterium]|nr:MAG: hypothetical protein DRP46_09405 [candidate division Zixibacteria bacterium]
MPQEKTENQIGIAPGKYSSLKWAVVLFAATVLLITGLSFYVVSDENLYYSMELAAGLNLINLFYPEEYNTSEMIRQARQSIFDKLDRYSGYLEPNALDRVTEEFSGSYGGIGITVVTHERGLLVMSVREDGPAGEVGMRTGDIIIRADTTDLNGLNSYQSTYILRGEEGTPVDVTVARNQMADTLEFRLIRRKLRLIHIPYAGLTENKSLYIRIMDFEAKLGEDLLACLDSLYLNNEDTVKAIILDLRGNPGGLLNEAVTAANLFLDEGHLIVGIKGRSRWRNDQFKSTGRDITGGLPLAILIDRGSASAAEIMAGSLKYAGRAVLIGDTTFGKGLVQEYKGLYDGSGIRLTTARYYFEGNRFLNDPGASVIDSAAGIPPDYYFSPASDDPFPLSLEASLILRDFAIDNKDEILEYSPFTEFSLKLLDRFIEYAGEQGFKYESDISILAKFARDEVTYQNYSDKTLNAIDRIRRIAEQDDIQQYEVYSDYIRQRLCQIAMDAEYGAARAYREAIIPYRRDIVLAEDVIFNKGKTDSGTH